MSKYVGAVKHTVSIKYFCTVCSIFDLESILNNASVFAHNLHQLRQLDNMFIYYKFHINNIKCIENNCTLFMCSTLLEFF